MPRAYIHCGFHKTASTYLQSLLRRNAEAFAPHLQVLNRAEGVTEPARMVCLAFARGDEGVTEDDVRAAFAPLAEQAAARDDVPTLVTDEAFLGPHPGQFTDRRLYPHAPVLCRLILEAFGPEAEIVLYLRQDDKWFRSMYAQAVRQDRYCRTEAEMRAEVGEVSLRKVADRIAAEIGPDRLTTFRLEDDRDHPLGTGGQLFDHVGLDPAVIRGLTHKAARNPSLAAWALRLLRHVNRLPISDAAVQAFRYRLFRLQKRFNRP